VTLRLPQALCARELYPGGPRVELRETHASWVFLAGEHAYKVKKPLRLEFLDYSTLARRRAACEEEVRVNRELAPEVYLGVVAIVLRDGRPRLAGEDDPGAVEYAVRMRRFEEARTLHGAIAARALAPGDVARVAARVAGFHSAAAPAGGGTPAAVLGAWRKNLEELQRLPRPPGSSPAALRGFAEWFVAERRRELERRVREGRVRDCHGDLRCEHVLLGEPVQIVDRIEFDPRLRHMDVACDLAFLAADLERHRRAGAARALIAAYRRAGGDPGDAQLTSFYGAYWSLVRAKVALIAAGQRTDRAAASERAGAAGWWRLALRLCWRARLPLAIVVCGPPASGKSTLAAALARESGLPLLSSDAVRKRRAGLPATARAGPERYTRRETLAVYEQLGREARAALERGGGAIVDATCQDSARRAPLLAALRCGGARLLFVRCEVALATALARAAARERNPEQVSDATPEVVERQFRRFEELDELPQESLLALDAERRDEEQVASVAGALDGRPAQPSRRPPSTTIWVPVT